MGILRVGLQKRQCTEGLQIGSSSGARREPIRCNSQECWSVTRSKVRLYFRVRKRKKEGEGRKKKEKSSLVVQRRESYLVYL